MVQVVLGIVLILFAVRQRRRMGRPRQPPAWMARLDRLSPWAAAGLGVFLQPWTLVAAGVATIVQAKLSTAGDYLTLVFFCLLATSSFLVMELYAASRPRPRPPGSGRYGRGSIVTGIRRSSGIAGNRLLAGRQ